MYKTKHSPGPWTVGNSYHDEDNNRIDITRTHGQWKDTCIVAMVRTTRTEEAEADAALIADAPDMLALLILVHQVSDRLPALLAAQVEAMIDGHYTSFVE